MNGPSQVNQPKIDIKLATTVFSPEGNCVFTEGVILKKLSKFVANTTEDAIIPVPCFYDIVTKKVLIELLPKELQQEFRDLYEKEDPTK
jgi:hypothetical protein